MDSHNPWTNQRGQVIVLRLPETGTFFLSLRGMWGVPIDPANPDELAPSDVDAGWLFAVSNE